MQAVYDASHGEFVINTPNNEASKYWIGGSGQHGKVRIRTALLWIACNRSWE
jgi:acyl-CoA oxidase